MLLIFALLVVPYSSFISISPYLLYLYFIIHLIDNPRVGLYNPYKRGFTVLIKTIRRIFSFAKPYRLQLSISVIALFAVIGINIIAPMLARTLMDNADG